MEGRLSAALERCGVDLDATLARFAGNEALYEKFLRRFPADPNFAGIAPALAREDWDGALRYAHTLKGVSGNLGLTRLFEACGAVVQDLRQEERARAAADYRTLEEAYRQIVEALSEEVGA